MVQSNIYKMTSYLLYTAQETENCQQQFKGYSEINTNQESVKRNLCVLTSEQQSSALCLGGGHCHSLPSLFAVQMSLTIWDRS